MPKSFYLDATDIPDNQRGAYASKNGRWELTELDTDHPTIATKTELETTQRGLKSQIATLTTQAADLQQKLTISQTRALPEGQVAVTPEVKTLGESIQTLGIKPGELTGLKSRAEAAETKLNEISFSQTVNEAAKSINRNSKGVETLLKANGLQLEIKEETVDGKPTKKFYATGGAGDDKTSVALEAYVAEHGGYIAPLAAEKDGLPYFGQIPGADKPQLSANEMLAAQLLNRYTPKPAAAAIVV